MDFRVAFSISQTAILWPCELRSFFGEPFPTLPDRAIALRAKSKISNSRSFHTLHKHLSAPHALTDRTITMVSSPSRYPVAASASIRRTMLANNRRVKGLSASINQ